MAILKGVKDKIRVKVSAEVEADLGETIDVPFVVEYKKPTRKQRDDLLERLQDKYDDDGKLVRAKLTDEELAAEYILGWSDLPDQNGAAIPFTPENLELLLDTREYNAALTRGLNEVIYGRKAALAKN